MMNVATVQGAMVVDITVVNRAAIFDIAIMDGTTVIDVAGVDCSVIGTAIEGHTMLHTNAVASGMDTTVMSATIIDVPLSCLLLRRGTMILTIAGRRGTRMRVLRLDRGIALVMSAGQDGCIFVSRLVRVMTLRSAVGMSASI